MARINDVLEGRIEGMQEKEADRPIGIMARYRIERIIVLCHGLSLISVLTRF